MFLKKENKKTYSEHSTCLLRDRRKESDPGWWL